MSVLCVNNLRVALKKEKQALVKQVCFSIERGKSLILLGQSGCGKTMTCHAIMDLLDEKRFDVDGEILLNNQNLRTMDNNTKRLLLGKEMVLIPQNPMTALDPSARIGHQADETLMIHTSLSRRERKQIILQTFCDAGLTDAERVYHSFPHMLSGGMLQRVLIAMAYMMETCLIIADEPTTALDAVHRDETMDSFIRLRAKGAAIVMVTHDFAAALRLGGTLLIMKDGQIIEEGLADEVYRHPKHAYTRELIGAASLSAQRLGGENNA